MQKINNNGAYQMQATALKFQPKWISQDSYGPWTQGNKFSGMASNPFYLVTWAWVTRDQYLSGIVKWLAQIRDKYCLLKQ
jgi:hypothetical protein